MSSMTEITFRWTLPDTVFTEQAAANMVGQTFDFHGERITARGTITAARLDGDGVILTIEVPIVPPIEGNDER